MREIEFRGKRTDTKEWVYGYLCKTQHESECYSDFDGSHNKLFGIFNVVSIMVDDDDLNTYRVIPETVGQYTGLKDKNGTKIYEGDEVRFTAVFCEGEDDEATLDWDTAYIEWCGEQDYPAFDLSTHDFEANGLSHLLGAGYYFEVVGNIHEKEKDE